VHTGAWQDKHTGTEAAVGPITIGFSWRMRLPAGRSLEATRYLQDSEFRQVMKKQIISNMEVHTEK